MSNSIKTMGVVAILMISCLATVCIIPTDESSADARDLSGATYWGFEKNIKNINDIMPLTDERIPGVSIQSVDELEDWLEDLAEKGGLPSDDIELELDLKGEGYLRGKKVDDNTVTLLGGASGIIELTLEAPVELIKMLFRGNEYTPSDNTDILMMSLEIKIDRYSDGTVHMNEKKEVVSYSSFSERAIHITGLTNVSVVDGKMEYGFEAVNDVDHLMASTMTSESHFASDGFKFMPEENEKGWEIITSAFVSRLGTIHNEATGVSADALDILAELVYYTDNPMIINPYSHSGIFIHEHGIKDYDITATVDRTGKTPVVHYVDNLSETKTMPILPFFEPLEILFTDGDPLDDVSKIFNEDMKMDAVKAQSIKSKINSCKERCLEQVKDLKVKIYYLEDDKYIYDQVPMKEMEISFGDTITLDIVAPEKEGLEFIGWNIAYTDRILWDVAPIGYCDMYLVASYGVVVTSTPTQQDFNKSPGTPLIWVHDSEEGGAMINGELLKENNVPIYVIGERNGKRVYIWVVDPEGTGGRIDNIDTTLKVASVPEYALDKIVDKDFLYLQANLGETTPENTLIYYDVSNTFHDYTSVDIYIDNTTELLFAGTHIVKNGEIPLHGEKTSGFLLVSSDIQPAPISPYPRGDNTVLIICAAISIVLLAIMAYMTYKK